MKSYDEIPSFLIESFSNKKLLFNEVNNYTYLFVSHKIPLIDGEEKVENTIYSKPFSILIFNKKYEKIYEKKFDGNIYNVELSFITNKEVFLSLNNPKNENFDENYFGYEIFQLKNKN
jgi:tRNA(Glu) U13 pseudouridine synthase TruD